MTRKRVLLHESTQRGLCQIGFLVLGLAPLLLCIYMSIVACIPGYHGRQSTHWERELEKRFGLSFQISSAHALAPYRFRLDNVEIANPTNHKLIATARSIHMELGGNDTWRIRLDSPELRLDQFPEVCRTLHHWYLSRETTAHDRTVIESAEMSITDGTDYLELSKLAIQVRPDAQQWGLIASFKISPAIVTPATDLGDVPDCQLSIARSRNQQSASTQVQLHIPTPIPCPTLAKLFELNAQSMAQLPSQLAIQSSQFTGSLTATIQEQNVDYRISNATISKIDLGRLSHGTEALVSGVGNLTNLNAWLNSRQLKSADGLLEVGPGHMDSRFLQSLRFHLGFALPRQQSVGLVGFDRMALRFAIQPKIVRLVGGLEDQYGPLAQKADVGALPIISLIHALAFKLENPIIPDRFSPLVRQALVWLPLDDDQRQQLASHEQVRR